MNLTAKSLLPACAVVAFAFSASMPVRAADSAEAAASTDSIVTIEDGVRKVIDDVVVESATYEKVTYTTKGNKRDVPGKNVLSINWSDSPEDYRPGWSAVRAGAGDKARKLFRSSLDAKVAASLRPWVDEFANIGLGEAYRLLGATDASQYDKALEAFEAARKANPKSIWLDRILTGIAECQAAKGNATGGISAAKELQTAAKAAKNGDWEIGALELQARMELSAGQHSDAARSYDALVRSVESELNSEKSTVRRADLERRRLAAAAAQGWVLVDKAEKSKSDSDWSAAREYFNGLPAKYGQKPVILAAKSNANGVMKFAAGEYEAARRLLEYTEVIYFGVADEVARSLYYQAECLDKLGRKPERADRIRALKEYYPRSAWASKL